MQIEVYKYTAKDKEEEIKKRKLCMLFMHELRFLDTCKFYALKSE